MLLVSSANYQNRFEIADYHVVHVIFPSLFANLRSTGWKVDERVD